MAGFAHLGPGPRLFLVSRALDGPDKGSEWLSVSADSAPEAQPLRQTIRISSTSRRPDEPAPKSQRLLEPESQRHEYAVVPPKARSRWCVRYHMPRSSSRDERGCMPNTALRSISRPCRARVARGVRVVAAAVADEIVECVPALGVQRHGDEEGGAGFRDPGQLIERRRLVLDVLDDIERATRSNAASAKGSEVIKPTTTDAPRSCSLASAGRAHVHELRLLERQARPQARRDLERCAPERQQRSAPAARC